MKDQIAALFAQALDALSDDGLPRSRDAKVAVERTRDPAHGDFACNLAMALAKQAGMKPRDLATKLIAAFPDQFRVGGLAARGSNVELVAEQVRAHRPAAVALLDRGAVDHLARVLPAPRPDLLGGPEGLASLAGEVPADIVLSALVGAAGRVVCGDTGVAHLATALRTPSVVLFGPTAPAAWGPPPGRPWHRVLWAGGVGDPHAETLDAGLATITVDQVLTALDAAQEAAA